MTDDDSSKRALLLTTTPRVGEVLELMETAGITPVATLLQRRQKPDTSTYLGSGKLKEAAELKERVGAEMVVVNGVLKPNQFFNLSEVLGGEVYDKIKLILEIFRERVGSREASLQVEMMELTYELPILKEYVHRAKLKEHPGFLAGGEYRIDYYVRRARRRMARLRRELKAIEERRRLEREMRRRKGIYLVSTAGYTNAGKTSLFNALTDEDAPVEQRLFTTLLSRVRAVKKIPHVTLADTVGFIEGLPPYLIEAFKPTLDDIYTADLVLLVLDISEEEGEVRRKFDASLKVIREGGLKGRVILVGNKIDVAREGAEELLEELMLSSRGLVCSTAAVSAKEREGLERLIEEMKRWMPWEWEYRIILPQGLEAEELFRWLSAKTAILQVASSDPDIRVAAPRRVMKEIEEWVASLGGRIELIRSGREGGESAQGESP